eukprot:scaffold64529_cov74-Phaeocystis_antarctica.AAC.6
MNKTPANVPSAATAHFGHNTGSTHPWLAFRSRRGELARLGLPVSVHAWASVAVAHEHAEASAAATAALLPQKSDLLVALRIDVTVRQLGHLGSHLAAEQLLVDSLQHVNQPALVVGRRVTLGIVLHVTSGHAACLGGARCHVLLHARRVVEGRYDVFPARRAVVDAGCLEVLEAKVEGAGGLAVARACSRRHALQEGGVALVRVERRRYGVSEALVPRSLDHVGHALREDLLGAMGRVPAHALLDHIAVALDQLNAHGRLGRHVRRGARRRPWPNLWRNLWRSHRSGQPRRVPALATAAVIQVA